MNPLDRINQFILLIVDSLRQVGQWRLWLPLFIYGLLQWFVLYAHYQFLEAPFYLPISTWISLIGPDQATAFSHYPQQFLLLGKYSGLAKLAVGLILEGLVLGTVAAIFYRRFNGEQPESYLNRPLAVRWINLAAVWLILNGLLWAAGTFLPEWLAPILDGPRRMLAFSFVFMPFVFISIFSILFMAIPSIVVKGENAAAALFRSLKCFGRRPFTIFGLAILVLALPILLSVLASRPAAIIDSFRPELVYWILATSLFVEMLAYFIWMGVAVRFLSEPTQ